MYADCTSKLSIAQYYLSKNLSVFPCHTVENRICSCGNSACSNVAKHPLTIHGVKDATNEPSQLETYFTGVNEVANIAIATGEPSGVFVLDVDEPESLTKQEVTNGPLPKTWTAKTGRGTHYYFQYDERCRNFKNATKFAGGLDIKTTGGYAIAAPSIHANGSSYEWIISPDDCDIAIAPDWLVNLVPKRDTPEKMELTLPSRSDGNANNSTTFTMQRARSKVEQLKLYLEKCPPAITGEKGHATTFGVVCKAVELFGVLTDDEIIDALDDWNDRCEPRWKRLELQHKLTDARRHVSTKIDVADFELDDELDDDTETAPQTAIWPILGHDAWHGIAGEIMTALESETEADIVGVLLSFLCAFGNAVGNRPHVKVGPTSHGTNLNVALVGDTASGKGQAWDNTRRLTSSIDDWCETCISYGLASGEGLVERVSDSEVESNVIAVPIVKRLLCLETEFARPITAMRRDGNTLSPMLRSAWDAQKLEIMTRGKSKLRASNAHISVLAHITPEELKRLLDNSIEIFNGFGNRFLWTLVHSTKSLPHGGNSNVLTEFAERLKVIAERVQSIGEVKRSSEADRIWETAYAGLKESKPGAFGRIVERGRPQVVRLSLIYALLDCSDVIKAEHLKAALAVWRYCEESALALFSDGSEADSNCSLSFRLRDIIRRQPGLMKTELRKAVSHTIKTETFNSALRWLIQRGDVVSVLVYESRQAERFYPGVGMTTPNVVTKSTTIADDIITTTVTITEPQSATTCAPASLVATFDWINGNGVSLTANELGDISVSTDIVVPPDIAAAFVTERKTLRSIATVANSVPVLAEREQERQRELDRFDQELKAIDQSLSEAEFLEAVREVARRY